MNNRENQIFWIISAVRKRRNLLTVIRGGAISLAILAALLLLTGLAAYRYRYHTAALVSLRIVAIMGLVAAVYFFLVRPLRRKISDTRIARLVEEKHSGIGDRLVSAVEFSDEEKRTLFSPSIIERLIGDADRHAREVNVDEVIPRNRFWQLGGAAAASVVLFVLALLIGPDELKSGVVQLLVPTSPAAASNAIRIEIKPGTARVPKGSDQRISASLINFQSDQTTVFTRKAGGSDEQWIGQQMEPAKNNNEFQFFIFNIQEDTEYFCESGGTRTEVYKLTVADLPFVKRIDQTQFAPGYTGLQAKTIEDAPDIAALAGTNVKLTAKLSTRAKGARIILADGKKVEMEKAGENDFSGTIAVTRNSSYHIELTSVDGDVYNGSNEYDITVLEDRPPTVTFDKPGRDMRATSVEEVFTQAKAEDDYGVVSLDLHFSVNGGEEKQVDLQKLRGDSARTLSGAHTFFLEEFGLQPGDLISYYARARDARNETTSDIYFIEVKPFQKDFKQSQQGGGGGDGEEQGQGLTKRQKQVVAATFRINRDEPTYSEQEKTENYNTVTLSQEKLYQDATALIERIKRRTGGQLTQDPEFAKLLEYLTEAAKSMDPAVTELKARKGKEALIHEQKALNQLMRADAVFREMQIAFSQDGQGSNSDAQELADLFELEMDKMKNQYETLKREQQQQSQKQDDETKRKLEELSQRMQRELEQQQQRMQQSARNGGGGGGSRQQQQMIDDARKAARELERLSRERRDPQLMDLSNKLNKAADEMQQAQNAARNNNQQEALSRNLRAQQQLDEAQRRLSQLQQSQGGQSIQNLRQRAANAAAQQQEIAKQVEELARRNRAGDQSAGQEKQQLSERKDALANEVGNLEKDLDQTARGLGQEQQAAANRLREAATSIRQNRVADRIRSTRKMVDGNALEAARAGDKEIQQNLDDLAQQLQEADKLANQRKGPGGETEALDRASQLANNVESMRRRLNSGNQRGEGNQQQGRGNQDQQNQNQQNQPGQGQPGQQQDRNGNNQNAQNRQQGQPGQNQNQGQQGQGQQGQGQQGQGQQGRQGQGQGQQPNGGQNRGQNQNPGGGGGPQQGSPQRDGGMPNPQNTDNPGGSGPPRGIKSDRQFRAELNQYLRDAEELKRSIPRDRDLTRNLDQAIQAMRQANEMIGRDDNRTAELLKNQVIDPLRSIELELSKRLQAKLGKNNLRLSDEGSAPERYRKLVDEYYKRLSSRSQ
jgi:uncharacterized protein DUF4175